MRLKRGCVTCVGRGGLRHLRPPEGRDASLVRAGAVAQRDTGPGTGPRGSGDRVQLGRSTGRIVGSVDFGPQPS